MWWIILLSVIGGLIILGILLFSIPFDLSWKLEVYGKPKASLRWSWLFGLLDKEIRTGKRAPKKPKKKKARGKLNVRKAIAGIRQGSDYLRIKGLVSQFIRFMKRALRRIQIRRLEAELRVGLDDPADTFYLFAITEPVNRIINYSLPYPVSIQPSFIEPIFEGYFYGTIRIYPVRFLLPLAQLIFSVPVFRLIKKVVASRWRRNR